MRLDTLAGTEDIRTDCGIALNSDITIATALQNRRHFLCVKGISAYRGNLAAAIDAMSNCGIALDSDRRVATNQGRVAMRLNTGTATEDAARDGRSTCSTCCSGSAAYLHFSVGFHAAYLTATIDVTLHRTVADGDIRTVGNTFLTPEGVGLTLTGSKYIGIYRTAGNVHIANTSVVVRVAPCKGPVVIRVGIGTHRA